MHEIVNFIDMLKSEGVSRKRSCSVLMICVRRVGRWRQKLSKTGSLADRRHGPENPLNKLTDKEVQEIESMASDAKYSKLSHRELAIRAQDEGRVFASKSTFLRVLKRIGCVCSANPKQRKEGPQNSAPRIRDAATAPNRVWSWDFTYVWTGLEWIYLICILDVHSRKLLSWQVTRIMTDDVAIQLWEDTLFRYGLFETSSRPEPLWSFSDHGSQMTSHDTRDFFEKMKIPMVYARYQVPEDNAIHESFHKTLKHDKNMGYYYWKVSSCQTLEEYMKEFDIYYNQNRTHSGIGDVTPDQKYYGLADAIRDKRSQFWAEAKLKRKQHNLKYSKIKQKEKRAA